MAKLTEIEDGESVGIGLAGSELPKRRNKPRARREASAPNDEPKQTSPTRELEHKMKTKPTKATMWAFIASLVRLAIVTVIAKIIFSRFHARLMA